MASQKLHELVSKYKKLYSDLGRPPRRREFLDLANVSDYALREFTLTDIARASGLLEEDEEVTLPRKPKILLLDIETAPIIAHTWGVYDVTVGHKQVVKDWHLLSYAAKWLDSPKIYYSDQRDMIDVSDDRGLLDELWHLIDEADILVGHNLQKFDIKKIKARFLFHKLLPPSPYRIIDTLLIARRQFACTRNTLEYLADYLKLAHKKSKHGEFDGHSLWVECMKGNLKAFKAMAKYNKLDVIVLEEVYLELIKWDKSINFGVYTEENVCSCGSTQFKKHGIMVTNSGRYARYLCKVCGKSWSDKFNLISAKERKGLLK